MTSSCLISIVQQPWSTCNGVVPARSTIKTQRMAYCWRPSTSEVLRGVVHDTDAAMSPQFSVDGVGRRVGTQVWWPVHLLLRTSNRTNSPVWTPFRGGLVRLTR